MTEQEAKTKLGQLISVFEAARTSGNSTAIASARRNIKRFRGQLFYPDLIRKIDRLLAGAATDDLDKAVQDRAEIANSVKDLKTGFTNATKAAEEAEDNLFFNQLSTVLVNIKDQINAYKDKATEIKAVLKDLKKPEDISELLDDVDDVMGLLIDLKRTVKSI